VDSSAQRVAVHWTDGPWQYSKSSSCSGATSGQRVQSGLPRMHQPSHFGNASVLAMSVFLMLRVSWWLCLYEALSYRAGGALLHPSLDEVFGSSSFRAGQKSRWSTKWDFVLAHVEALVSHVSRLWSRLIASSAEMHEGFRPHSMAENVFDQDCGRIKSLSSKMKGPFDLFLLASTHRTAQGNCSATVSEIVSAAQ